MVGVDVSAAFTLYLFAHFWSRIQILRLEGLFVDLSATKDGKRLLAFLRTLESSRIRILDREFQRGIGELLIERSGGDLTALTFYEFAEWYWKDPALQSWFAPLHHQIQNTHHTRYRQRLLVYGTVVHALINTLDSKHRVTTELTSWANKLSKRSRVVLEYQVFGFYLQFVKNPRQYTRPGAQPERARSKVR